MTCRPTAALALATIGGALLATTATGAGAQTAGSCRLTAQPWDERPYVLEVHLVDGTVDRLVDIQDGSYFPPVSWDFPVGALAEVRWALMDWDNPADPASWGDVLPVDGCAFTVPYDAAAGKVDSVVIAPVDTEEPTTTTTTAVEPTEEEPPAPEVVPPPVDLPRTVATLPTPTTQVLPTEVERTDPIGETPVGETSPTTVVDELPFTGAPIRGLALTGLFATTFGAALLAFRRVFSRG